MSERIYNFYAGPAVLPEEVLLEVKEELPVYRDIGTSVLEISHRSKEYTEIAESARQRMRRLLGLGPEWHILFLQGGASLQFHMVPLNFLPEGGKAAYLITGAWSKKALKEAQFLGNAEVVATSEDTGFDRIPAPDTYQVDDQAAYLHFTSNNTIFGTQFKTEPEAGDVPLVCDASSDFLSRRIALDKYGLIYAGAQKNVGPAGVTIVLIREDFLQQRNQPLPTMLDYGTHTAKLFNTPPVFAVYMVEKVLKWLEHLGGLPAIEARNEAKAQKLYEVLDASDFYRGTARPDSRSLMNVTFRLPTEALEQQFVEEARAQGMIGLKGHRSVGGIRASIYNACPPEAVDALTSFMKDFEQKHG